MKNQEAIVTRLDIIESALEAFGPQELISLKDDKAQKRSGAENREQDS